MVTNLILASNSPRRKELLTLGGLQFKVQAADVDESFLLDELPQDYVLRLAQTKSQAVVNTLQGLATDTVVVAADTAVVDDGMILGKPRSPQEAVSMLQQLQGHTHLVYTAIAVYQSRDGRAFHAVCETPVPLRKLTDQEIEMYVDSGDPLDKAGAYAIQNANFQPVLALRGCFASVMGLPLCHLASLLRKTSLPFPADIPTVCQDHLSYNCDSYPLFYGLVN